jgi:hypothetical protein
MTKKGNLSEALSQYDRRPPKPTEPVSPQPAVIPSSEESASKQPPSRKGKKALTGYFDPEVLKQLKLMAVAEDKTVQALMTEALNELFKKYGKPHIA